MFVFVTYENLISKIKKNEYFVINCVQIENRNNSFFGDKTHISRNYYKSRLPDLLHTVSVDFFTTSSDLKVNNETYHTPTKDIKPIMSKNYMKKMKF